MNFFKKSVSVVFFLLFGVFAMAKSYSTVEVVSKDGEVRFVPAEDLARILRTSGEHRMEFAKDHLRCVLL